MYLDLTSVPPGSIITSASFTLFVTREPGTPPQIGILHRILASWGEAGSSNSNGNGAPAQTGDATWSHRFYGASGQVWATAGGDFAAVASSSVPFGAAGTSATFASTPSLVAEVQNWVDDPAANQGWAILGDEAANGSATQFGSRENSNAALRPRLGITYTTSDRSVSLFTPMTAIISMASLFGTGLFHLRRKRVGG